MAQYRIQIHGHLDQRWEAIFCEFTITHHMDQDGEPISLMTGQVPDQSALYGIINRLRNMGVELISVQPEDDEKEIG